MNNNKGAKAKRKNIKKNTQRSVNSKSQQREAFSFQQEMIDLISAEDSPVDAIREEEPVPPRTQPTQPLLPQRQAKLTNGAFLIPAALGRCYWAAITHEQSGKAIIAPAFEQQLLEVNGKELKQVSSNHPFVFQIKSQSKRNFQKLSTIYPKEDQETLRQFISGVDLNQETIIVSSLPLTIKQCQTPWVNLPPCIHGNETLMILGQKNTGKSTLAEYLLQSCRQDYALLDCDIGRNSCMEGCVSLSSDDDRKMVWIGELSPLNNLQTYLRAIKYLFSYYRQKLFTKKLIVNTMGYTTGLGELLIYEIYQIVQPHSLLVLQTPQPPVYDPLVPILNNFANGQYVNKLYLQFSGSKPHPSSSNVYSYTNQHAVSKKTTWRFQKYFQTADSSIRNIQDLLRLVRESDSLLKYPFKLQRCSRGELKIYEQSKHGKEQLEGVETVIYRQLEAEEDIDMRLVVLGKMISESQSGPGSMLSEFENETSGLFEATALGFCFEGYIYSSARLDGLAGVVNEGIDFEKKFYHLSEKQLLELQLRMGRLKYLMVSSKGLGSKGVRNNPSKVGP